jgi:hypothetical protein
LHPALHAPIDQAGPEAADPGTGGTTAQARHVPSAAEGLAEVFGTWERIFYGESDGRPRKRVLVKIVGE